jgi:hypothetical protein
MTNSIKRLTRKEASAYLLEKYNIHRSVGTLATLASRGGSPRFQNEGRLALYEISELDKWAQALLKVRKK